MTNEFDFYSIEYYSKRITPFNNALKGENWENVSRPDKYFGGYKHYGQYASYPEYFYKGPVSFFNISEREQAYAFADRLNKEYGTSKDPQPFSPIYIARD